MQLNPFNFNAKLVSPNNIFETLNFNEPEFQIKFNFKKLYKNKLEVNSFNL
jgi:hypothetical protein